MPRKPVKVRFKKLKDLWGVAYPEKRIIHIDPSLLAPGKEQKYIEILLHELEHIRRPWLAEEEVKEHAADQAAFLMQHGVTIDRD